MMDFSRIRGSPASSVCMLMPLEGVQVLVSPTCSSFGLGLGCSLWFTCRLLWERTLTPVENKSHFADWFPHWGSSLVPETVTYCAQECRPVSVPSYPPLHTCQVRHRNQDSVCDKRCKSSSSDIFMAPFLRVKGHAGVCVAARQEAALQPPLIQPDHRTFVGWHEYFGLNSRWDSAARCVT